MQKIIISRVQKAIEFKMGESEGRVPKSSENGGSHDSQSDSNSKVSIEIGEHYMVRRGDDRWRE